jgi:hypothetical protein
MCCSPEWQDTAGQARPEADGALGLMTARWGIVTGESRLVGRRHDRCTEPEWAAEDPITIIRWLEKADRGEHTHWPNGRPNELRSWVESMFRSTFQLYLKAIVR